MPLHDLHHLCPVCRSAPCGADDLCHLAEILRALFRRRDEAEYLGGLITCVVEAVDCAPRDARGNGLVTVSDLVQAGRDWEDEFTRQPTPRRRDVLEADPSDSEGG